MYTQEIWRSLPGAGAACFLGFATARDLTALSVSELGSSKRFRLAGFGRVFWNVVFVLLINQGSVLAMTVDILNRWSEG